MSSYQTNQTIERIQSNLKTMIGEKVKLKANLGRSKTVEAVGVLEEAHPKLFILSVKDGDQLKRLSYSYADLLTQTVEISHIDAAENVLDWLNNS